MSQFLEGIYQHLCREFEVAELEEGIKNRARESMNKAQKEFYLREQIRAIKNELGEDDAEEIDGYRKQLDKILMTEEVRTEVIRQINRLERMAPDSMEAGVLRTYLDWIIALPWGTFTEDNLDIARAKEILDEDHYGLKRGQRAHFRFYLGMQFKNGWSFANFMFYRSSRYRKNITRSINCSLFGQKICAYFTWWCQR